MRLLFITSGLAPGRNGVGDYTRDLAEECRRRGHDCSLIALNDEFVREQEVSQDVVPVLRLGQDLPWASRVEKARAWLAAFAPDRACLQFVPYGFHAKGLPFGLSARLQAIVGATPVAIMFHELWIGAEIGASWKKRAVGWVQKHIVRHLVRTLAPLDIQTSNSTYVHLLRQAGISAGRLPMFGAVPVRSGYDITKLDAALRPQGVALVGPERKRFWMLAFFGALHPVWPAEPFFGYLRTAAQAAGKEIVLISAGRLGPGENLWNALAQQYGNTFRFCRLGEVAAAEVATLFHVADFGVATTPYALIGKSASAAAMIDHGLPVIVNRDEITLADFRNEDEASLLIRMDERLPEQLPQLRRQEPQPRLPAVAGQFLAALAEGRILKLNAESSADQCALG